MIKMKSKESARDLFRLDGRVALITGASGLLGPEYAKALADFGADVVLADIEPEKAHEIAEKIACERGVRAMACAGDVTSRESWLEVLDTAKSHFGKVDILVNNAACTNQSRTAAFDTSAEEFPIEDWNAILEVNLTGTFLGCQVIGAHMLERGKGSIINIGSLYGVVSPHHRIYEGTGVVQPPAYSVSKAGVIGLTRYLATLWAERGVRVNCITPGGVFNDHEDPFLTRFGNLNPIGRMETKDELRGAVVFLASDASSHCVGHNLVVDGGWTVW